MARSERSSLSASRSNAVARTGISTRSATLAASTAAFSILPGVSTRAKSAPPSSALSSILRSWKMGQAITAGLSPSRRSAQRVALPCGSRSIRATLLRAAAARTARAVAIVVLPDPPFCPRMAPGSPVVQTRRAASAVFAANRAALRGSRGKRWPFRPIPSQAFLGTKNIPCYPAGTIVAPTR